MKKRVSCEKVKVLSKDYIFYMANLYWFITQFSHNFSNWISNLMSNMTYNIIKTHFFVYQALHYSQIYNFTLNHDYKFKTIIVLKDVRISKSKKVYVFLFFENSEHMDLCLWNISKFTKKLKWFGEVLIKKRTFEIEKPHVHELFFSDLNI